MRTRKELKTRRPTSANSSQFVLCQRWSECSNRSARRDVAREGDLGSPNCDEAEGGPALDPDPWLVVRSLHPNSYGTEGSQIDSVCIVSMLRLHSLVVLAQNPMDKTWYGAPTAYWSAIEANLAIVCASAPALKPLVVKILPAFSSQMGSYGSNSTRSGSKSAKLSFIRLKGTKSQSTMDSKDLESGAHHDVTALPAVAYNGPNRIHVTRDFEQHSENNGRYSESESQKDLVPDLAPSHYHKSRQ